MKSLQSSNQFSSAVSYDSSWFKWPLGWWQILTVDQVVVGLDWWSELPVKAQPSQAEGYGQAVVAQLRAYLDGRLQRFELQLRPSGTAFQQRVWQQLQRIPFGQTWSYLDVARELGSPGSARAVGGACGRNPIPVILPCHRVVAAGGRLGGYTGGLDRKIWLLQHEGVLKKGEG